jgi:hypothetical protein
VDRLASTFTCSKRSATTFRFEVGRAAHDLPDGSQLQLVECRSSHNLIPEVWGCGDPHKSVSALNLVLLATLPDEERSG